MILKLTQNIDLKISGEIKVENKTVVTLNATINKDNTLISQNIRNNQLYADNLRDILDGLMQFNDEVRRIETFVKTDNYNELWGILNG